MKAMSLSVFHTRLGPGKNSVLVTVGQEIEGDESHIRALALNGLVELPGEVKGIVVDEPLAGTGEAVQMPAPDGREPLPPEAKKKKKGKK